MKVDELLPVREEDGGGELADVASGAESGEGPGDRAEAENPREVGCQTCCSNELE